MIDWKETILTGGSEEFISPVSPSLGSQVTIKLKIYKENPVQSIFIRMAPNGEQINIEMKKKPFSDFYSLYEISFKILTKITNYRFGILTKDDFFWFNSENVLIHYTPSDNHDFKLIAGFEEPTWIKESIFYQIFPDRFYDGDPSANVKSGEYEIYGKKTIAKQWNEFERKEGDYPFSHFYGGDLAGIRKKIPYFKELGVTALYLNPIFFAPSNHKYDIVDYKTVDPHFGTNKEFAELVSELHKNGIRVILDGIFNHTGVNHYWFDSKKIHNTNTGAFNNKDSQYYEFYTFYNWPEEYESWMGHKSLPKLNYKSTKVREEIYKNKDSVMKFWLSEPFNVDGWRIDVANMLARQNETQLFLEIWEDIRNEVKRFKPDAYIMGEHFFDGSALLDGKKLDAIMNYQGFNFPLLKWLTKSELFYFSSNKELTHLNFSVLDFQSQLAEFRNLLPFQIQLLNFNLLGSHDLPRFLTRLNKNIDQYKLSIIFLYTYIGVPSIYYGDEVGMEGSFDPDNRKPMVWDKAKWNEQILEFYKKMIELRKSRLELRVGIFKELFVQDEVYVFSRIHTTSVSIIILNNNEKSISIMLPLWKIGMLKENLHDYFNNQILPVTEGLLKVKLKSRESIILFN